MSFCWNNRYNNIYISMTTNAQILAKHEGCDVETINNSERILIGQDVILPAMDEYALIKMIEENESILKMAELHMDVRAVLVLKTRILELDNDLSIIRRNLEQ